MSMDRAACGHADILLKLPHHNGPPIKAVTQASPLRRACEGRAVLAARPALRTGRRWRTGRYVARSSNRCYVCFMSSQPEITQRDLRMRSKEILDAVEHGQAFTVTRDGLSIGELVPLRQRRRFVSRAEFVAMSRTAPAIDTDAFRADQDAAADQARGAYDQ
jgi:prevent-host-death family protein